MAKNPNYLSAFDAVHWLHLEMRKSGRTINGLRCPLSDKAQQWLKDFNGCPEGYVVPWTWQFASNPTMQAYMEERAHGG